MNYTLEETHYICKRYKQEPTRETVNDLATELDRSPKSITGKLSKEGVYRRTPYMTKTGEPPITKIEIVEQIANQLDLDSENLNGLDKTPKQVLKLLDKTLQRVLPSLDECI